MKRVLSLLLVFTLILSSAIIFASCKDDKKEGEGFDFTKEKMKDYITLNREDYIGIEVEAEIYPEITEDDVDGYIEYILSNSVEKTVYTDKPIEEGDTVSIYFRGECDGVEFETGSNYADASPASLVIGSGSFIEGFEDGLIGVVPNTTSLTKIDSGKVKADYIAYVSYSYTYVDESGAEKSGEVKEYRIDLANPKSADAIFVDKIVGQTVGTAFTFDAEYDVTGDGEAENASFTMKVKFATMEETAAVKVTFPDPYKNNEELSGKEVI
ncbi:MAG: FKBP-type peptidyl-prolyl cis-trans isomerase, partial [Clostridia bacterium]|nr:FKBP-type peptidyl-prolyl cis-trans isomerase [Clostridia bacterium]